MNAVFPHEFDSEAFLTNAGLGRKLIALKAKQTFFSQGDVADSVFFIQKGRAKVTVVSRVGREATITLLAPRDFVGEEALARTTGLRQAPSSVATSSASTASHPARAPAASARTAAFPAP